MGSDEGRDILARIVQSAMQGKRVAILGQPDAWKECEQRRIMADVLVSGAFGQVSVFHVGSAASAEPHEGTCPSLTSTYLQQGTQAIHQITSSSSPSESSKRAPNRFMRKHAAQLRPTTDCYTVDS